MADNISATPGTGLTLATDEIGGVHWPRTKLAIGSDGSATDVSAANPMPVTGAVPANTVTSGTLTASDAVVGAPVGDGTLVSGSSTAGSIVWATVPDGFQAWTLLIKGYVSGAIYTEASNNTTNGTDGDWVEVKGRRTGTAPGTESVVYAMVANGYYRGNCAGFKAVRARLIGGTGATIQWQLSNGAGAVFLNSGIPGGSSNIGSVTVANASIPVTGTFFQATQPVSIADNTVSGTITTQNLVPAGTATASSAVEVSTVGMSTVAIQVEGTYTGALTVQARINATGAWVTLSGASVLYSMGGGVYSANAISSGSTGLWVMDCSGFTAVRMSALAAVTGTATLNMRATPGTAMVSLDTSLPAGTASLGTVGLNAGTQAIGTLTASTTLIGDVGLQVRANATGAASVAKIQSAATTNATAVKASAGRVLGWHLTNTTAAVKVVHLHNLTVAPTVGTSVPAYNIVIPANGSIYTQLPVGIAHTTGISYSITGAVADLDATAVAANDVVGAIYYA